MPKTKKILLIGGTHGVEPQSEFVARHLARYCELRKAELAELDGLFDLFLGKFQYPISEIPPGLGEIDSILEQIGEVQECSFSPKDFQAAKLVIIPNLNRYGLEHNKRGNNKGVDLNRNMPSENWSPNYLHNAYYPGTHPASEAETKSLVRIIEKSKPDLIISIHTNHFVENQNYPQVNYDGPLGGEGEEKAQELANILELPLTHDIGYPTPGSLGSYSKDQNIPCITIEMDDKYRPEGAWAKYGFELIKFLSKY